MSIKDSREKRNLLCDSTYDNKLHKNDFWSKKRLAMQTDINGETYSYEFSNFRFKI
tara:strand:+ start:1349 stop:1516 length:168 start_codon:yes stop_codon:yes gene_type:complete